MEGMFVESGERDGLQRLLYSTAQYTTGAFIMIVSEIPGHIWDLWSIPGREAEIRGDRLCGIVQYEMSLDTLCDERLPAISLD